MLLLPGLLVPGLLLGPVTEKQVCMITLQTRVTRFWCLGGFPLQKKTWTIEDEWPEIPFPLRNQSLFPPWPTEPPGEHYRELMGLPEGSTLPHLWETSYRELPFAFIFPVPNIRAMNMRSRPVFEMRIIAAKSLSPEDQAAFQALDNALREGITTEEIRLKGRQKLTTPDDFAGQATARELQAAFHEALHQQESVPNTREAFRQILLQTLNTRISAVDDPTT